jgi:hypothetical protein
MGPRYRHGSSQRAGPHAASARRGAGRPRPGADRRRLCQPPTLSGAQLCSAHTAGPARGPWPARRPSQCRGAGPCSRPPRPVWGHAALEPAGHGRRRTVGAALPLGALGSHQRPRGGARSPGGRATPGGAAAHPRRQPCSAPRPPPGQARAARGPAGRSLHPAATAAGPPHRERGGWPGRARARPAAGDRPPPHGLGRCARLGPGRAPAAAPGPRRAVAHPCPRPSACGASRARPRGPGGQGTVDGGLALSRAGLPLRGPPCRCRVLKSEPSFW